MTRKDPALLWFGGDFYDDEAVLQMNLEQQGAYLRLLWIAWRNDGLPADQRALARMLGLPLRRFAASIWPALSPCWTEVDGRLTQKRQEEERDRRAGVRQPDDRENATTRPAESPADGDRSAKMRELARRSWQARRMRSDAQPQPAHDAQRNAHADAQRNAARNAETQSPPVPPSVPSEAKYPNARNAQAQCAPHAQDACATGAIAARQDADPAAEGSARDHVADAGDMVGTDPVVRLQAVLTATRFRSALPPLARRFACSKAAAKLHAAGLAADDVQTLATLDEEKAETPGALLAHWIDGDQCRAVLDEQAMKQKERGAKRRGREAAGDDMLDGIYGGEQPQAAGGIVEQVLQQAAGGA